MTVPYFLIGWFVLGCVLAPVVGRLLARSRMELEARQAEREDIA